MRRHIYPAVEAVGMWESRRDFQRVWEGWKPASWLSMLSILCHFHDLLFARQTLDKQICRRSAMCRTRHEMLIGTHRLSLSAFAILHQPRSRRYDFRMADEP